MNLETFFQNHPKLAIAFSGGVDSAYLLYAATQAKVDVRAYYVHSQFQPAFEVEDARRLADQLHAPMTVLRLDALADPLVCQNGSDRCYHCKHNIMGTILKHAADDGFPLLCDGTNASDDADDRPGMRALRELDVRSPLREAGLTKTMIRRLSKDAGLFTWDKPAYACLATRIPTDEVITEAKLEATEAAEDALFQLGFTDFRVRMHDGVARLQVPEAQLEKVLRDRGAIVEKLKPYYKSILLDLEVRT